MSERQWVKVEDAPLGVMGFVWHRAWRSPFPGKRIGDMGMVWIDTCDAKATGREDYADWWCPFMVTPERDISAPTPPKADRP